VLTLAFFLILFGIGYGGGNSLRSSLGREYFGRTSFGTIFGLIMGINMLGGLSGPPLAGWVYDNWGTYQGIWFVFAGLAVVALILVLTTSQIDKEAGDPYMAT
jgi:MFS family permease